MFPVSQGPPSPLSVLASVRGQIKDVFPLASTIRGTPDDTTLFIAYDTLGEPSREESEGSVMSNSALVAGNVSLPRGNGVS